METGVLEKRRSKFESLRWESLFKRIIVHHMIFINSYPCLILVLSFDLGIILSVLCSKIFFLTIEEKFLW